MKIEGSGSESGSGSISPRHGSADPDPHHNIMDPQHWCQGSLLICIESSQSQVALQCPVPLKCSMQYAAPDRCNNADFIMCANSVHSKVASYAGSVIFFIILT
jgi:hypothetical protein